jgi:hypothetical protein
VLRGAGEAVAARDVHLSFHDGAVAAVVGRRIAEETR